MDGISKKISAINYTGISPDEIRKMSAVKVICADTYDDEGYPIEKGLMDSRMGVIEPGLRCKTCGCKVNECTGHFGHVELARPVIHVGFVKNIQNLLEITCSHCARLLFTPEQIQDIIESRDKTSTLNKRLELRFIRNLSNVLYRKSISKTAGREKMQPVLDILIGASPNIVCPYCQAEQKRLKLDKPTTFREVDTNNKLTTQEIREWLERINDDDLRCIGIDPDKFRPEWMVFTVLPIPPVTIRPTITLDSGERSEDDLTHKLVDVIRINERLRENRDSGAPQLIVEDLWELLQYHVTTYFDNQTFNVPPARHRSGRALKTLAQRLKGKEGRFRSNLSGKRVDFSARTVISPDPLLSINEVGVPIIAARELTVSLYVNDYNIDLCRAYVRKGIEPVQIVEPKDIELLRNAGYYCVGFNPETGETDPDYTDVFRNSDVKEFEARTSMSLKKKYTFGIDYILRPDGRTLRVNDKNCMDLANLIDTNFRLSRQLIDGDVVLFNRQPSLHRMSVMAHRVRVMEGRTFRFNPCVCPPYNAGFDGGEMNIHILQSEEARAEARILMQVQENILSPRYGGPIIGAIHDHITGAYFLTHNDPHFGKQDAMSILTKLDNIQIPDPKMDEDGNEYWSGKQLFSIVLPGDLNVKYKAAICKGCDVCEKDKCKFDAFVNIQNGQLICGTVDAKGIGNSKGKILDYIVRHYDTETSARFIENVTKISLGAIMERGFTLGIDDESIPYEASLKIKKFNERKVSNVNGVVTAFRNRTLDPIPGHTRVESMNIYAKNILDVARDYSGKIVEEYLDLNNPSVLIAKTGARGNMLNLTMMIGCVGQQSIRGERIKRGYDYRILPHFKKGDFGAYARGFIVHSYKDGLSPTEFFFHAMGGRDGLVDKSIRPFRTGYLQRKLSYALADLKMLPDCSVRDSDGNIIQFVYGEDGADPAKAVRGKMIDVDELFNTVFKDESDRFIELSSAYDAGNGEVISESLEIEDADDEDKLDDVELDFESDE